MFEYIQEQYSLISGDLLKSNLTVNATVYIKAEDVKTESTYRGVSAQLEGKRTNIVKQKFPQDLQRYYRIKVYISEKTVTKTATGQIESSMGIQFEPYDCWVSCLLSDVSVRSGNTIFDFADYVQLMSNKFDIKGLVPENFGNDPVLHIFLVKNTAT